MNFPTNRQQTETALAELSENLDRLFRGSCHIHDMGNLLVRIDRPAMENVVIKAADKLSLAKWLLEIALTLQHYGVVQSVEIWWSASVDEPKQLLLLTNGSATVKRIEVYDSVYRTEVQTTPLVDKLLAVSGRAVKAAS